MNHKQHLKACVEYHKEKGINPSLDTVFDKSKSWGKEFIRQLSEEYGFEECCAVIVYFDIMHDIKRMMR